MSLTALAWLWVGILILGSIVAVAFDVVPKRRKATSPLLVKRAFVVDGDRAKEYTAPTTPEAKQLAARAAYNVKGLPGTRPVSR